MVPAFDLHPLRRLAGDGDAPVATVTPREIAALLARIDAGDAAIAVLAELVQPKDQA